MSKVLFLVCETDGLHKLKGYEYVSTKCLYKCANLIKLSYDICIYENGKLKNIEKTESLIKPEHFYIKEEISKINGLREADLVEGESLYDVIESLKESLKGVKYIISHNLPFYIRTIQASSLRTGVEIDFSRYILIDLMSYKHNLSNPSLKSLSEHCFGKKYLKKGREYNLKLIKKIFEYLYNN